MDKIRFRDLQRWVVGDIEKVTPVAITSDSQVKFVVISYEDWVRVEKYVKLDSRDSQSNKEGSNFNIIRTKDGLKKIEIDADGYEIRGDNG